MSQPPPFGSPDEQPDDDDQHRAPGPGPWGHPAPAMPHGDWRFYPGDPLVSADFRGWWQRGFAVVRKGWRPLALVQLIIAVPALALLVPGHLFADLASRDLTNQTTADAPPEFAQFFAASGISLLATLLATLIYSIGSLATVRLVVTIATGADARAGRALRSVLPRIPALIGWSLLSGLIVFGALLACVLPVLYVGAVFVLLPAVVLFERSNVVSRCFSLFHHDLGAAVARIATVAGLGLGIVLPFAALSTVITAIARGSSFLDPRAGTSTGAVVAGSITTTVSGGVGTLICGIILTPLIVATYADLRARREPFTTAYLQAG